MLELKLFKCKLYFLRVLHLNIMKSKFVSSFLFVLIFCCGCNKSQDLEKKAQSQTWKEISRSARNVVSEPESQIGKIHANNSGCLRPRELVVVCPSKCQCFADGSVNCSRMGFTDIPKLPKNVTALDVSGNKLTVIKPGSFSGLDNLTSVDLSQNPLNEESFTEKSFEGAQSLATLYFGEIPFLKIPNNLPATIKSLYVLYCQIHNMTSPYLSRYAELRLLDLTHNYMDAVAPDLNKIFPNLYSLDVSFNGITDNGIQATSFQKSTKLITLSFRFNKLTRIPMNLPNSLGHLDFVGNPISVLHKDSFQNLDKLQTLEIWESGLKTIEDFAFRGLSQLTILDVMDCHVSSSITNYTFNGLASVTTIDISLSNVTTMDSGALLGQQKLQQLWLNDNPFETLNPLLFANITLPSISEIYLWGNKWHCDCKLKWLKEMQEQSSVIQDPHLMVCEKPGALKGKTWDSISSSQFLC